MNKILFIILIMAFSASFKMNGQEIKQLTSREAAKLIQSDKDIVILDVRTAQEFQDGHIKGARNMDMKQPEFLKNIEKLDRNARYVVHCRTSNRSTVAANWMQQKGFKNIYLISDGFNGWKNNGLPVE